MLLATVRAGGHGPQKPSVLSNAMGVGKATVIAVALVGGMMVAGVRSSITSRAESTSPQGMSHTVKRLGPVLNQTVRADAVAQGFQTPEDFAATVHAARNIRVPFAALKHQVVDEGQTLTAAIHAVKPAANASLEADLARSEARADLAAIE